jgi:hypothetical protein
MRPPATSTTSTRSTRFGPFKPALGLGGYRTPIAGLYLSGASTHPTRGVCALPGKRAAQTLMRDARGGFSVRSADGSLQDRRADREPADSNTSSLHWRFR